MMKILAGLLLAATLVSCQSMKSIEKNPNCIVWKDQEYLGPYSIEVVNKAVKWNGSCRTADYRCREVNVSYDDGNNVYKDTIIVGKIENNKFTKFEYSQKDPVQKPFSEKPLFLFSSVEASHEAKVLENTLTNSDQTVIKSQYKYNEKCSAEDAVIGGISLGLIEQIQKSK